MRTIHDGIETKNPGQVLKVDETPWRLYAEGILTWTETGSEDITVTSLVRRSQWLATFRLGLYQSFGGDHWQTSCSPVLERHTGDEVRD